MPCLLGTPQMLGFPWNTLWEPLAYMLWIGFTSIFGFGENAMCILPKSLKSFSNWKLFPRCLWWCFRKMYVSIMCFQLCVGNMWLFSYRLKNVKWWPLRKNPCGLSLNVPTLQLYQMKQLELSLNTAMIYAKTCLFYRYTAVKDFFFSVVQKKKSVLVVKKMLSTDLVPFSYFV